MPFAWEEVSLHAAGASAVRVRLTRTAAGALSLAVADTEGRPVASVGSLVVRPVAAGAVASVDRNTLFRVDWVPVEPVVPVVGSFVEVGSLAEVPGEV
ncbi:hypothetical protein, partial [Kitasatospora aureofaciens]|uniref:hypothetical protein n=1 Tax=Kitasatospora aureofaciens TaxID=1894 RepID=UPI0012FEC8A0